MSVHEEIVVAINCEIDCFPLRSDAETGLVAAAAMLRFCQAPLEPHIHYASLEHFKQMSRRALAGRYGTEGDESNTRQQEMFSGTLQDRYPVPRERGAEPIYRAREALSEFDARWNVAQLRKSATARMRHADALQAWCDGRFSGDAKTA